MLAKEPRAGMSNGNDAADMLLTSVPHASQNGTSTSAQVDAQVGGKPEAQDSSAMPSQQVVVMLGISASRSNPHAPASAGPIAATRQKNNQPARIPRFSMSLLAGGGLLRHVAAGTRSGRMGRAPGQALVPYRCRGVSHGVIVVGGVLVP